MKQSSLLILTFLVSLHGLLAQHYQHDKALISRHTELIELSLPDAHARLAIAPKFQGKVMIATTGTEPSRSIGWIDREALQSQSSTGGNAGGLDRIWLGPLGGQHSLYYQQIKPLDEANWQVPKPLAAGAFKVSNRSNLEVEMWSSMKLANFVGTEFDIRIDRKITLYDRQRIAADLAISPDLVNNFVAFGTSHTLTNTGTYAWSTSSGLLSLWSANMLAGTPNTTVIIPLTASSGHDKIYRYFGPLDSTRFQIRSNVLFFRADGDYRSKIGIPPHLAPEAFASYSPELNLLTIVKYQKSKGQYYFNSLVGVQKNPYEGEVLPIYNNGAMNYQPSNAPTFYELESTSPMRPLAPGEQLTHQHSVYHFTGSVEDLSELCKQAIGVSLPHLFFAK